MVKAGGGSLLILVSLLFSAVGSAGPSLAEATVYYNEACHDCAEYIAHELVPLLQTLGVTSIVKKDFINERAHRKELNERSAAMNIPPKLQGHFTAFVGDRIVLQGHVPEHIIRDLFKPQNVARYERIVVLQDKMVTHGQVPTDYTVWAFKGPVKAYPIDTPVDRYLDWLELNKDQLETPREETWGVGQLLPFVVVTGLIDGVNPCAFAVLLFFIAFLFTLHRTKFDIIKVGLVYIAGVYVTYVGIGLGLLKAITLSGQPHLMAYVGSYLMIGLGLVNVKDYFWYGRGLSLGVLRAGAEARERWMRKATLPAAGVVGVLVGLCEFPCTGGVYVAALGLLSAKTTASVGVAYLALYNVMFVAPLLAILVAVGNRRVAGQFARWEAQNKRALKLSQGLIMVLLGVVILAWFV